jgi:replicative DNA helicase
MNTVPAKTVPYNIEAEEAVLGAALIDPQTIWTIAPVLQPKDFYLQKHQWIYEAMLALSERGERLDFILLTTELEKARRLEAVGSAAYISQLSMSTASFTNALAYAGRIVEASQRRELLNLVSELARRAYNETVPVDETLNYALMQLQQHGRAGALVDICDVINDVHEKFTHNLENPLAPGEVRGIDTGWIDINNALGGWSPGFYVVLGEPHVGKTWFVLQAAAKVAQKGGRVLFFSLEMTAAQLALRLCLSYAGITKRGFESGRMDEKQQRLFVEAEAKIHDWDLRISDDMDNAAQIFSTIHREMRGDNPPQMVVIDYLGLMTTEYKAESTNWEMIALTRGLKNLSRQLQVPIITPHQVSDKATAARNNHRPQKSDGYGSGGPSQDADVLLGLYRESLHSDNPENPNTLEVIVLKDRLGGEAAPNKSIPLRFLPTGALVDAYKPGPQA